MPPMKALTMHYRMRSIVGFATLGAVATMVVLWGCGDPTVWKCSTIERIAAVVTIFSLILSPGYYFVKRWHSDRAEGERAATAVYTELADAHSSLDPDRHRDLRVVELPDQTKAHFMSRLLNHDVYDSLVNSGKITFIAAGLQQDIQDVFQHVKDHNTLLRKVRKMQEAGGEHPRALHLYRSLGDSDDALRRSLPRAMRKIEAEYAIPGVAKAGASRPARP